MGIELAIVLGIVQALTEFLPVSSSGHLVLAEALFGAALGIDEQGVPLSFGVIVHVATLLITVVYLRDDLLSLLQEIFVKGEQGKRARYLAFLLALGSVPAAIVGLGAREAIEAMFNSIRTVGYGLGATTLLLMAAHFLVRSKNQSNDKEADSTISGLQWDFPTVFQALLIGVFQAFAIVPGVSRSGATIATALVLGLNAESALRFSFLLSLPAIIGASLLESSSILNLQSEALPSYGAGFLAALVAAWFAIRWVIVFTKRSRLVYFAIYTAMLSAFIIAKF